MTDVSRARLIVALTAHTYGVPLQALYARGRRQPVALARQTACWLIRRHTALSYPAIGRLLGRDHSTVLHAVTVIDTLMPLRPELAGRVGTVIDRLREAA